MGGNLADQRTNEPVSATFLWNQPYSSSSIEYLLMVHVKATQKNLKQI